VAAINKIYLGNRPVESLYMGNKPVRMLTGSTGIDQSEIILKNLPTIANPVDSIVPKIPQNNFKSTSPDGLAALAALGFDTSILTIEIEVPCDRLPTKADITNVFNQIAQIPAKLKQQLIERAEELAEDVVEQVNALIKDIEDLMDMFAEVLSPYWEKGKIRNWQKEAKDCWDELIQDFHIFIPVKMLEMISKLIPIDFNIVVLGIEINVLKIFTEEEQQRIKTQIIEKIPELPEPFTDLFNGRWQTKCDEWRAKYTWQYIKNEIMEWCTNALWKAFEKLIDKFKEIWEALGLPDLPALLDFDLEEFIQMQIERLEQEARDFIQDLENQLNELVEQVEGEIEDFEAKVKQLEEDIKNFSITGYIIGELEQVEIFGKKLIDIIGGPIDENVLNGEERIADLMRQAKEWFAQWQKELINAWIRKIKKFLEKIGLDKLLALLDLDFCEVLKLLGIPTTFTLSV